MTKLLLKVLPLVVAIAVVGILPGQAIAQAGNSITITSANSPAPGQILGNGTYTLDKGWKVESITMLVFLNGKLVKSVTCDFGSGNWGGLAIGLTSGTTYQVGAVLVTSNNGIFDTKLQQRVLPVQGVVRGSVNDLGRRDEKHTQAVEREGQVTRPRSASIEQRLSPCNS
ncbi:MAG TPA: hypothetical protein VKE98_03435 [Gemmataceae bacterium]|nr:hypothetical protein [Gemmataceae bacterium]